MSGVAGARFHPGWWTRLEMEIVVKSGQLLYFGLFSSDLIFLIGE